MAKREFGEIIQVIKRGGASEYKVRLAQGEIVIVPHALLRPSRMTLLSAGARLLVEHELGRVRSASTELSITQKGLVASVRRKPGAVSYRVEVEQGGLIEISKDRIQPHPANRPLLRGAELELAYQSGALTTVRLVSEKVEAAVTAVNPGQRTITVMAGQAGEITIRLEASAVRQIQVHEMLDLEIAYTAEGKRKYTIQRKQAPGKQGRSAAQPTAEREPQQQAARPRAERPQPPRPDGETPPAGERIEAGAFGMDPQVLEQAKRAGHRREIVAFLEKHARDGLIEWYDIKPGRTAQPQQPSRPPHPQVQRAIQSATPEFRGFFKHQALALDAIRAGRSLVIVTQTASGKTLSYNPAIFEDLLADPQGHVLYVFPLNALMTDQLEKVNALIQALEKQGVSISAARMVGGMQPAERDAAARANPNIVVTNPEMLNYLLERADRDWKPFFSGLKIIVVDEVHSYRGIFGVHMTGIIRRLRYTARRLGADPRFVISSATVNNPLELAARLTGLPARDFDLIGQEEDGSQQADKHWLVLNPDWGARKEKYTNYQEVAAEVFVEMLLSRSASGAPSPLSTILFCRSMREVRSIKGMVDQRLEQKAPNLKRRVRSYISANLTSEIKREIYDGLRSGELLGVISTNALEAGIDIGSLDACVIAGFPFSVMTLRQMAGRVGRKEEGVVFFIPYPLSSLDQYYSDHPELLLTQPPEEFVVDPHNPYIARKHINAAAYPAGLSDDDLRRYWGAQALEIAARAQQDGVMIRRGERWLGSRRDYRRQDDPYQIGNIRSNAQVPYAVCREGKSGCPASEKCFDQNDRSCENRITLLDQQYVYRDCHPGAVYESPDQGIFRILSIDDAQRVVKAAPLPETCPERTFVEADIETELSGAPRARKQIFPGVEMAWGDAVVTRLYTGYHQYTLQPARRCRRCRKEFEDTIDICPYCSRPTERFFNHSRPEHMEFSAPYQQGFRITLKTVACWIAVHPQVEAQLASCSPCRLPGEQNRVLEWLKRPLDLASLPARLRLTAEESQHITGFHRRATEQLAQARPTPRETLLFPGIYGQCLLASLRSQTGESRALELFEALTGYPVTRDLRHICRDCRRSVLLPAMHTLEHAVAARYPSVALGDRSDIGAFTTLGHPATGLPTIFWFDNYEGGLGAAEKIFEIILRLLESGLKTLTGCTCTTVEGCPRCTYIPDCSGGNADLSKPAGALLLSMLLGSQPPDFSAPFIYSRRRAEDFAKACQSNETAPVEQGLGEEAPAPGAPPDPYLVLRLQRRVHGPVINKAFEVRSREIVDETPPISAGQLNEAYQHVIGGGVLPEWQNFPSAGPYEILEVLPSASLKMLQQVYRVIALHVHPDANPGRTAWANEMMKRLNAAYDAVLKEKNGRKS